MEIPIHDQFVVQPELLFTSQGANSDVDDDDVAKLSYLSIALLAKHFVNENFSVLADPQIGFLLSAKRIDDDDTYDLKEVTKSTDIGFDLGLEYKLEQGVFFGARYCFGTNINSTLNSSTTITNGVFQFSVGYFLNDLL